MTKLLLMPHPLSELSQHHFKMCKIYFNTHSNKKTLILMVWLVFRTLDKILLLKFKNLEKLY